jgi:SAM-dependent methyltransferase
LYSNPYPRSFYEGLRNGARCSAEVIVPLVLEFLTVRSVVDVGCGDGTWLSVFHALGVADIFGIDGAYVARDLLQVPHVCYQATDLSKPFALERTFDLAVSLEVAEHLPASSAALYVHSLTRLAPAILFSAAIPFQGGHHHLNEQWPDKWAELFGHHHFLPVDFVRKRVWENEAVEWWYAQNTLLFVSEELLASNGLLRAEFERTNVNQLRLIHPRQYLYQRSLYEQAVCQAQTTPGLRAACRTLVDSLKNSIRWRFGRRHRKEIAPNPVAEARQPRT